MRRPSRPRLDALETRLTPANATWDGGGADTNWTTAANWVGGVAPQAGGGPLVRTFNAAGTKLTEFLAYEASFRGGVTVAARDLDGDGVAEIVTGTGTGGGPLVRGFTAAGAPRLAVLAFDPSFLGGVYVG